MMQDKTFTERVLLPIANISGVVLGGVLSWNVVLPESFIGGIGFIALWFVFSPILIFILQLLVGYLNQKERLSIAKSDLELKIKQEEKLVEDVFQEIYDGVNPFGDYIEPISREELDESNSVTMESIGAIELTDSIVRSLKEFQSHKFPLLSKVKSIDLDEVEVIIDKANLISLPSTDFIPLTEVQSVIIDKNQVEKISKNHQIGDVIHVYVSHVYKEKMFTVVTLKG